MRKASYVCDNCLSIVDSNENKINNPEK
jgi:hypothetical protein